MSRYVLASLVAVVAAGAASAKPAPVPTPAPVEPAQVQTQKRVQRLVSPLLCDTLGITAGLPNSNVRAIVQDKRGFMWLGTQDGLVRYDGSRMRVFRPSSDTSSLSSGFIAALAVDASGKVWVGTPEGGVSVYNPDTDKFTRYAAGKGGLSSDGVTAMVRDGKDRMWFAMSGGGLNQFDAASGTFADYQQAPLNTAITAITTDEAGNLWLGTADQGVIRWNPDNGQTSTFRPTTGANQPLSAPVASILSSAGKIWIGSDGEGLYQLDAASGKVVAYRYSSTEAATLSDDHASVLFLDQNKSLWIGTPAGLNRIDASGKVQRYVHDANDPTTLSFPAVEALYQDQGGVMWVGGHSDGVCKFTERNLKFGRYHLPTYASSFFEDADGSVWLGTLNYGLLKYERAAQRVTHYQRLVAPNQEPVPLDSAWLPAVHRDRRGTLWLSVKGLGLIALDTKTEHYKRYVVDPEQANSLPVDTVFDIWEDAAGMLWLATWGGGLVRFDPKTEAFTPYTDSTDESIGLSSNHLYTLYPDPTENKVLWVGTAKGGLVRFDIGTGTGTSFRYRADDPTSLSSDDVLAIYRDAAGMVWLGTYGGGLNRLDPKTKKVERFTTGNSGLTNDMVQGILPADDGKLWLSTNGGGLLEYDPKTNKFLLFDASDGANNEFAQGSFMRSAKGELFFGGAKGFNAFFPKEIKRDPYVPPIVMTGFRLQGQDVKLSRPIWTLPPLDVSYSDSFELQFAALAFAAPGKNHYAYKLEGVDDHFIETDHPLVMYTKLDGGNYTLRVRASNQHGVWNETGIALKLHVTPPIWRTWFAYGVYMLILAIAAYVLIRYQRVRVQRAEREGRLAVVERDLELTGAVQSGFLPEHNEITTQNVRLYGLYRPADACSGDWWWYEPMPNGRHLIIVGDVTGHGPGPAMVTAAVATAFRVFLEDGLNDIEFGLQRLNRQVLRVAKGKYHMTMAVLELEDMTGRWVLHSAGSPPMLSLDPNGKHRVHFCPGAPLGTETGFATGKVEGKLEASERVLLYTDGIPEITLPNGNVLGMRRFAQQYEQTRTKHLRDAAVSILHFADQMRGNQPQSDDWTFALIEWG